ncbi:MAG TPA: hypothetical protein VIH61_03890 [Waddliaceae bacterium]
MDMKSFVQFVAEETLVEDDGLVPLSDFVKHSSFVTTKGHRRLQIISPHGRHIFTDQRNGKLTKPREEILKGIHHNLVKGHIRSLQNAQLPHSTPYERSLKPLSADVLSAHPDLAQRHADIVANS